MNTPWIEKYRPKIISDIVCQEDIRKSLQQSIYEQKLPHLLFHGPSGSGKTSAIIAIARELYGKNYKKCILELTASDERGIDTIRNRVKKFASVRVNENNVPYKIIIMDEADTITEASQLALRRIIEKYSRVTRFCLICNHITRISDAILSRCVIFRFQKLDNVSIKKHLNVLSIKENKNITQNSLDLISNTCDGDMRKAINNLQTVIQLYNGSIDNTDIYDICGKVSIDEIDNLWSVLKLNDIVALNNEKNNIIAKGLCMNSILKALLYKIIDNDDLTDVVKGKISNKISKVDKKLAENANESIQLLYICSYIMKYIN